MFWLELIRFCKSVPDSPCSEEVEKNLIFAGLVGMIDPERKEAAAAIAVAKGAGVRTVMITGDHAETAQAIAERLGILPMGEDNRCQDTKGLPCHFGIFGENGLSVLLR